MRIEELKIVFVEKLVPDLLLSVQKEKDFYFSTIWQLLFRKNNGCLLIGKKKQYSCWPFDFVGADHCFIGILNLPIDVVSDGLHSQKQCIIIPSVGGSSSKQVYCFFICLRAASDCVCGKVDAIDFNQR